MDQKDQQHCSLEVHSRRVQELEQHKLFGRIATERISETFLSLQLLCRTVHAGKMGWRPDQSRTLPGRCENSTNEHTPTGKKNTVNDLVNVLMQILTQNYY